MGFLVGDVIDALINGKACKGIEGQPVVGA